MTVFVDNIRFVTVLCGECGVPFAMTESFQKQKLQDRTTFYCPSGHPRVYTGKTEAQKLQEQLDRERQVREAAEQRALRMQGERDQVAKAHKRMRTRVMNGVCPCCNRTFQNLLRHMQTEHQGELTLRAFRDAFGMTQAALAQEIGVLPMYLSNAERGKYVPRHAQSAIDAWMAKQEVAQEAQR